MQGPSGLLEVAVLKVDSSCPWGVCFYGACVTSTPGTLYTSRGGQEGASFHVCNKE